MGDEEASSGFAAKRVNRLIRFVGPFVTVHCLARHTTSQIDHSQVYVMLEFNVKSIRALIRLEQSLLYNYLFILIGRTRERLQLNQIEVDTYFIKAELLFND